MKLAKKRMKRKDICKFVQHAIMSLTGFINCKQVLRERNDMNNLVTLHKITSLVIFCNQILLIKFMQGFYFLLLLLCTV
jgi:hypothetical protein